MRTYINVSTDRNRAYYFSFPDEKFYGFEKRWEKNYKFDFKTFSYEKENNIYRFKLLSE